MEELKEYVKLLEEKATTEKDKIVIDELKCACNDVNDKLPNGLLPIMLAIKLKDNKLIDLLIKAGADISYEIVINGKKINAIRFASLNKDKALAEKLKATSIKKTKLQKKLIEAIGLKDRPKIVEYINDGASLNVSGKKFVSTPLIRAAELGMTDVVEMLLKNGATPDCADMMGSTALMWAGRYQGQAKVKVAQMLIDAGADVNSVDREYGSTPLISWTINSDDNSKYLDVLLKNGANVLWRDAEGKTASDYAKEVSSIDVYKYLRQREKLQIEFNNKVMSLFSSKSEGRIFSYEKKEKYLWIAEQIRNGIYLSAGLAKFVLPYAQEDDDVDIVDKCENAILNATVEKKYVMNRAHSIKKLQSPNKDDDN